MLYPASEHYPVLSWTLIMQIYYFLSSLLDCRGCILSPISLLLIVMCFNLQGKIWCVQSSVLHLQQIGLASG